MKETKHSRSDAQAKAALTTSGIGRRAFIGAGAAALDAAMVTGKFALSGSAERATAKREALGEYNRLKREIDNLRAQAKREKQMNRRVELNLATKRLEAELTGTLANL